MSGPRYGREGKISVRKSVMTICEKKFFGREGNNNFQQVYLHTESSWRYVKGEIHTTDMRAISPTGMIIMTNTISYDTRRDIRYFACEATQGKLFAFFFAELCSLNSCMYAAVQRVFARIC